MPKPTDAITSAAPRVLTGTVFITRQVHFNSAHRLCNPAKSQQWNEEHYGLCTNPHWHGHNYVLEVTVEGPIDDRTGYVIDLGKLRKIVEREVIAQVDHRNMNLEVPFLEGTNPTAENIVVACWRVLAPVVAPGRLSRLRLWETENNYVEYEGR
jgi:6-pyruvoyltetrahydropterin/6-carboxytetrahydropterin synthase